MTPRAACRFAGGLAVMVAGATYLYPEGLTIYGFAIGPVMLGAIVLAGLRERRAGRPFGRARWIPLAGFAGILAALASPDLVHLIVLQLTQHAVVTNDWWTFFQRFLVGRDDVWGDGFARIADFVAGVLGFYFVTPGSDGPVALIQRVVILVAIAGLVAGLIKTLRERDGTVIAWTVTSVLMLVPALVLVRQGGYWAAGKILSYAAAVYVPLLCLSLARRDRWRWFAVAFVALQLGSGVVRIAAATWDDHIGYARPYPGVQNRDLKRQLGWDLTGLEPILDRHSKVTLFPSDPWSEAALVSFLTARRIPYFLQNPVHAFPGGPELGKMPVPWTPKIQISVQGLMIQVEYLDHRLPNVQIPTR